MSLSEPGDSGGATAVHGCVPGVATARLPPNAADVLIQLTVTCCVCLLVRSWLIVYSVPPPLPEVNLERIRCVLLRADSACDSFWDLLEGARKYAPARLSKVVSTVRRCV